MKNLHLVFLGVFFFLLSACDEEAEFVPKPKGYHRIDLPKHQYQKLQEDHPYTFEYAKEAVITKDVSSIAEPHWINVHYSSFDSDIQLTYKPLNGKKDLKKLSELIDDSYKLANKHQVKAYSIEENIVKTPSGKYAHIIEISGDVPSHFQFYISDSSQHFLRGALYFKSTKTDSLEPVIEHLKVDVMHLINTIEWRK